jgi:hypothetical protein
MAVWTISAQEATGGARLAGALAAAADVSLFDRETLALLAHQADPALPKLDDIDERFGGRFNMLALSTAMAVGSAEAFREVELRHRLPALGRAVVVEAARTPCVICASAAFAALSDHPSAIHVRLRAPLEWRIAAYQREQCVNRQCAEKALRRADHRLQAWVRSLYHVDVDDARHYSLVLDASRLSSDRLVEILLAAAGYTPSGNVIAAGATSGRPTST